MMTKTATNTPRSIVALLGATALLSIGTGCGMSSNESNPSSTPRTTTAASKIPLVASTDADCLTLARAASTTFGRKIDAVTVTNADKMYPAFKSCYFAADAAGKSTFSVHLYKEQLSPAAVQAHLATEYSDDAYGPKYRNVAVPGFATDQAVYSYQSSADGKLDWGGSGRIYMQKWRVQIGAGLFDPTVEQAISFAADVAKWTARFQ